MCVCVCMCVRVGAMCVRVCVGLHVCLRKLFILQISSMFY